MDSLPRFPELLLDGLLAMLPLHNVLALTSVDRRESIGRAYVINQRSRVWFGHREHRGPSTLEELTAFHVRFPQCFVSQFVRSGRGLAVPFARAVFFANDAADALLFGPVAVATGAASLRWPLLEHVTFGHTFDRPLAGLPASVRHITVSYAFNQPLAMLPANLLSFESGFSFSQPLASLPTTVTALKLGNSFGRAIAASDVPSVRLLSVGRSFNHALPSLTALETLELTGFNQALDGCKFPNLHSLLLRGPFDRPLPPSLTAGLRSLTLGRQFDHPIDIAHMPHLQHLELGDGFDSELDLSGARHLRTLTLGHGFTRPLLDLPDSLEHLRVGYEWAGPLCEPLPPNLVTLSLNRSFVDPLPSLSSHTALRELRLGSAYDQPLVLPAGLVLFEVGDAFNRPLQLPASLERLNLGAAFDQRLTSLPTGLRELRLQARLYAHALPPLPATLVELDVDVEFFDQHGDALTLPPACNVRCRRRDEARKAAARRWRSVRNLALLAVGIGVAIFLKR